MFDLLERLNQTTAMLSVKEVAELFGVSTKTVQRMISKRDIPSVLVGGQRRFDPKVLYWWYAKRSPDALKARG